MIISIHALRVEGDRGLSASPAHRAKFLSTPSGWRATFDFFGFSVHLSKFLSTPSGWRATFFDLIVSKRVCISIHALRVEGDFDLREPTAAPEIFLSTPSGWRATRIVPGGDRCRHISIHALRVEGDINASYSAITGNILFLSTPSGWRATRLRERLRTRVIQFLSTPSGWRATSAIVRSPIPDFPISIHALRVEGDH